MPSVRITSVGKTPASRRDDVSTRRRLGAFSSALAGRLVLEADGEDTWGTGSPGLDLRRSSML